LRDDGGNGGHAERRVTRQLGAGGALQLTQRLQHREAVVLSDVVVLDGAERHSAHLSKAVYKLLLLSYLVGVAARQNAPVVQYNAAGGCAGNGPTRCAASLSPTPRSAPAAQTSTPEGSPPPRGYGQRTHHVAGAPRPLLLHRPQPHPAEHAPHAREHEQRVVA